MFEWKCHEMRKWIGHASSKETEIVTVTEIGTETEMMEADTAVDTEEEVNGVAGDDSVEEDIKDLTNMEEKANGADEIIKGMVQKASFTWYFNGNDTQLVPGPWVPEEHVANLSDDEMKRE